MEVTHNSPISSPPASPRVERRLVPYVAPQPLVEGEGILRNWTWLARPDESLETIEQSAHQAIAEKVKGDCQCCHCKAHPKVEHLELAKKDDEVQPGVLARVGRKISSCASGALSTLATAAGATFGWMNQNAAIFWVNQGIYKYAQYVAVGKWGATLGPMVAAYSGPSLVTSLAPVVGFVAPAAAAVGTGLTLLLLQRVVVNGGAAVYRMVKKPIADALNAKQLQAALKKLAEEVDVQNQLQSLNVDFKTQSRADGSQFLALQASPVQVEELREDELPPALLEAYNYAAQTEGAE